MITIYYIKIKYWHIYPEKIDFFLMLIKLMDLQTYHNTIKLYRKYLHISFNKSNNYDKNVNEIIILYIKQLYTSEQIILSEKLKSKYDMYPLQIDYEFFIWRDICRYEKLSELFMYILRELLEWDTISECQNLSENFILLLEDKVNWNFIFTCQKLSNTFKNKYKYRCVKY